MEVVRFLREANPLKDTTNIASVSGGSILAALLVLNGDRYSRNDEEFQAVLDEVFCFVIFDVRNRVAR